MASQVTDCDAVVRKVAEKGGFEEFFKDERILQTLFSWTENEAENLYHDIDPSKNSNLDQSGKVILVTGAGRGIGQAIALMFARANAKVIAICSRTEAQLEETRAAIQEINPDIRVIYKSVDIASESDLAGFINTIAQDYGRIDVVVSNAGIQGPRGRTIDQDVDTWWKQMEINLKGSFLVAKHYIQSLKGNSGTLINISSASALWTMPGQSAYITNKIATLRLFECLHIEHPEVRLFNLHPGPIDTQMTRDGGLKEAGINVAWTPPEVPAGVCVWLTSPDAEFLRGRWISANWKVDELVQRKDEIVKNSLLKTAFTAKFTNL